MALDAGRFRWTRSPRRSGSSCTGTVTRPVYRAPAPLPRVLSGRTATPHCDGGRTTPMRSRRRRCGPAWRICFACTNTVVAARSCTWTRAWMSALCCGHRPARAQRQVRAASRNTPSVSALPDHAVCADPRLRPRRPEGGSSRRRTPRPSRRPAGRGLLRDGLLHSTERPLVDVARTSPCSRYRRAPWMSRLDHAEVAEHASAVLTTSTDRPRSAASR